jgi:uncharacterized coiled-coil protein SlyX
MSGLVREPNSNDRRKAAVESKWTFNKSISYGDLMVTASLLLGGVTAYFSAEKRISQLEYRTNLQEETSKALAIDMRQELRELKMQSTQTQMEVLRLAAQPKERVNGSK